MCLTLTLTFQGHLIFLNSPFVPLHDWCKFWSDIFINSGDIAHWNMEKLPILYNGNFRCHGNVCYVFRINPFFCKLHRIGPSHMCVNFEKNRLRIEDFRKSEKIVFFLWRDVVRQNLRGNLQKRHYVRNVFQLTKSFYDFRFKSYGPLCDIYKSGDLDLDLYPIFTQKFCQGPWNWIHQLSKFQKDWAIGVACTSFNYGQADRQTNRGDQYTLQKSTILQSNKPRWPIYFAKIYDFAK